ncbi:MAG: Potassium-transporting ATPase potassium-binding subunit [Planctomycetes bacterium]|nr:Potassium-transporting ATPase potassium-binding subunit [Planctomycetota bacterium]
MTAAGWLQIAVYVVALAALTKPLGAYMYRAFETDARPWPSVLGRLENLCLRLCGPRAAEEQTWTGYLGSLMAFSVVGIVVTFALQMLQGALPLNPQGLPAPSWHLALNTAVSFTTNTNWQSYGGETTMSYLTQMAGLAWQNFVSAAAGIGVALALARGLTRTPGPSGSKTLGSFWADLVRSTVYVLLPLSLVWAVALVACGVVQNFSAYVEVTTVEGAKQTLAMGPAASQVAIKQLGTNGGGFFNVNSAHPFENPGAISNFLQCLAILLIPAALTHTYGKMARDTRQGWAIFTAMAALFLAGLTACYLAESQPNAAIAGLGVDQAAGNLEGKEVRFGVANSALWATATTAASNGSVNSMHDSYTPLGGLVPLLNIQLGEVVFGGVGAGLYGMLVFVLLSVFIAGLMVGRTPEYLGKKVEAHEMKVVTVYVLVFALFVLVPAAWASVAPGGLSSLANRGPHGLSEILYACSSAAGNNGSAFAGLNANTPFWNCLLAVCMFFGRFAMIAPCLAIAGSMVGKKTSTPGLGTFPTHGGLFATLLVGVIVIVGALTFLPALSLGPIVEHFLAAAGRTY